MLVLATAGGGGSGSASKQELRQLMADGLLPEVIIAEDALNATSIDDEHLAHLGGRRGRILRRLPRAIALSVEVWSRRGAYDAVLSWGEPLAFPLALLLALSPRRRIRHIAILMWPFEASSPSPAKRLVKRRLFPPLARHGIDRLCVPAPLQRRMALERWSIPAERIVHVQWAVDTRFWHPMPDTEQDTICSVGREMRDYATLIAALDGLDVPCHIAAGTGVLSGVFGSDDPRAQNVGAQPRLPAGVTTGPLSFPELRELYARSRVVVVPIMPSESDNGITAIAEAMAMGRAVISTDTAGKADILEDGVTCVLVPPRDPEALRQAILALWNDPERCARLGAEARRRVVGEHGLDQWLTGMRATVAELAASSGQEGAGRMGIESLPATDGTSVPCTSTENSTTTNTRP
jgi:glycosyltransferase involved in cell wall biosynthesis